MRDCGAASVSKKGCPTACTAPLIGVSATCIPSGWPRQSSRRGIGRRWKRLSARKSSAAQGSLLSFRQLGRSQDNRLAAAWAGNLNLGRDFSLSAKVDAALRALTLEQVNDAWRRYIRPEAFVMGVAGDFASPQ